MAHIQKKNQHASRFSFTILLHQKEDQEDQIKTQMNKPGPIWYQCRTKEGAKSLKEQNY